MTRIFLAFLSLLLLVACTPDPGVAVETAVAGTVGAQAALATATSPVATTIATAQPTPPPPTAPPTRTPLPTLTPVPFEALRLGIIALLGESNRGLDKRLAAFVDSNSDTPAGRQLRIQWALQEDQSLVLTLEQAQREATQILQAVYESGLPFDPVVLSGTFVLEDAYGDTIEDEVLVASYTAETLDRIQWENFKPYNVFEIASFKSLQRQFQEAADIIEEKNP